MNKPVNIQDNADLVFFGKVNASISHELKNILAVISEASGLLSDLVELAEKGKSVQMEMFKTCSQDIEEEIRRGFETVKTMNAFSHSVDKSITRVPLIELINLTVSISQYLSYASKVKIRVMDHTDPVISTSPFRLQHLIYNALDYAFKIAGPDGEIQISVNRLKNDDIQIAFSPVGEHGDASFPEEEITTISNSIKAKVQTINHYPSFDIIIPKSLT
jgi:signal transduction histidine kinase